MTKKTQKQQKIDQNASALEPQSSPVKTSGSSPNLTMLLQTESKIDFWPFLLNMILITIFIECEINPFINDGPITEGLKLGFVHLILGERLNWLVLKYFSGVLMVLYANFRLVKTEIWLENLCFLMFLLLMGLFFARIHGNPIPLNKMKNSSRLRSVKSNIKNLSFKIPILNAKLPENPIIPWEILENLWKKSEKCLVILDSNLKSLYSTQMFDKFKALKPKLFKVLVEIMKFKVLKHLELKTPNFSQKTTQSLEDLLQNLISTTSEANLYIKLLEKPQTILHVFRYFDKKSPFLILLYSLPANPNPDLEIMIQNQSRVLSFVSHEFRTPLNCINGMLQCLEEQVPGQIYEQYIQPALSSGKYLMNMLQDILDMTQIKAGKFSLNCIDFDLNLLLKDIFTLFQVQSKMKKIDLSFQISPTVPKIINTDPNRLKQVIINLLSNAFKYTQKGEITLICEIVNEDIKVLKLSVQDTGLGIKDDDKPRLLKAFGKIEDDKNKELNPQGIGLGLIISQDITRLLADGIAQIPEIEKGLHFESEYQKGSVFSFFFENKNRKPSEVEIEDFIETEQENQDNWKSPDFNFSNLKKLEKSKKFFKGSLSVFNKDITPFFPGYQNPLINKFFNINANVANSKKASFAISDAPTVKEIICQMSFPKEENATQYYSLKKNSISNFSVAESRMIFRNFSQNGINKPFVPEVKIIPPEKMSVLSDMSISFTSNSKKSVSDPSKLQEIKSKLENSQKKCACPDVLIVDDDSYNILALQFLTESLNLRYESATSGQEALMKVKDLNQEKEGFCCRYFKVIFLDIEMPGKNGLETCREIKEFFLTVGGIEETKILACSGYNDQEMNAKIKEAGFDSQLVKPILKGTLIGVLAEIMGNSSSGKSN